MLYYEYVDEHMFMGVGAGVMALCLLVLEVPFLLSLALMYHISMG